MGVATWAIQERDEVLRDARAHLPSRALAGDDEGHGVDELLDVVHRAFVARLGGAVVHPDTVADLRLTWGEARLAGAAEAVAAALRRRAEQHAHGDAALLQKERQAITSSLDELVALFDPEGMPLEIDVAEPPRATLVTALRELARPAPSVEEPARRSALLRARAQSVVAARSLQNAHIALLATGLVPSGVASSAADELIVVVTGATTETVGRLVRAAGVIARALGPAIADVAMGLVAGGEDALDAVVRAGALAREPGLLVLDDDAWSAVGAGLAAVPGHARAVDPAAAFGHDRWELSALLVRPPFLGRDDEVQRLARGLADPSEGPVLFLLQGPAGIGKAALVRAALGAAGYDDESAPVMWGAADPQQPTPYAALAAMIRALAGAPAGHPRAAARIERLVSGLADVLDGALDDGEGSELRALLPVLLTLLGADDDDAAHDRGQRALRTGLRRAIFLLTQALLARADDGRPAVFIVPGADALDAPTRDVLLFCARRLGGRARIVLLSSSRVRLPADVEEGVRVERMEVRGLPAPAARAIVGALLDRPDDDAMLGPLVEKARGAPLALLHGVRFAVEGGLLRRRDDRWEGDDLDGRDLPGRVDRLLRGRVERLPVDTRRLLGGCAALGVSFLPSAVEFVGVRLGLTREEVARHIGFLVDAGFLVRTSPRPGAPVFPDAVDAERDERPIVFEHPLLRAAAEAGIADDERARLHGIVADALEAVVPSGSHALSAALARHHRLAGRVHDALERLEIAARRSARLDDRPGALALAREGIDLAGADAAAAFPFLLEVEALRHGGSSGAHKDALRQLVRAAEQSGDGELRGQALARVARSNLACGDAALAVDAAQRALEELRGARGPRSSSASHRAELSALRTLSLARFHMRDVDGAQAALAEARALVSPSNRKMHGALDQQEGLMLLELGDAPAAVERLLRARMQRASSGDVGGEAACIEAIADAYVRRGRLSTALALLERAARLREKMGDEAGLAIGKMAEAEVLLSVGEDEVALAAAEDARARARAFGLDRVDVQTTLLSARIRLRGGAVDEADELVDAIRRRARDPATTAEVAWLAALVRIARATRSTGASRERTLKTALARAREAAAAAEEARLVWLEVLARAAAGEALLLDGDAGGALPWAQQAAERLDEPAATRAPPEEVLGVYARVLEAIGDLEEAAAVRARALSHLDERARRLPPAARERFWSVPARRALDDARRSSTPSGADGVRGAG
jgi:tetratricopeptide (TPR) repeat protein